MRREFTGPRVIAPNPEGVLTTGDVIELAPGIDPEAVGYPYASAVSYPRGPITKGRAELNIYGDGTVANALSVSCFKPTDQVGWMSASGGPFPVVDRDRLEYAGRTLGRFWDWSDGRARADNGVEYHAEVNLWHYTPEGFEPS